MHIFIRLFLLKQVFKKSIYPTLLFLLIPTRVTVNFHTNVFSRTSCKITDFAAKLHIIPIFECSMGKKFKYLVYIDMKCEDLSNVTPARYWLKN